MRIRMMASAGLVLGVLVAGTVLGACGTSSEPWSAPEVCPARPAASPTTNRPDSASGSPSAPKLTALEIAQRLPSMPSAVSGSGFGNLLGDDWYDFGGPADPHVLSSASRGWSSRVEDAFGNSYYHGGNIEVRVYDSSAARSDADRSVPQGVYTEPYQPSGRSVTEMVHRYRCTAACGAVSVEVWAEETREVTVAWANDAVVQSQSGLEQLFGGCPAADDVAVPSSEVSP